MNIMLRTVDKAADAPRQAELISETLARFAHDLNAEAIPTEVRERAKHLILDATGIALASNSPASIHESRRSVGCSRRYFIPTSTNPTSASATTGPRASIWVIW